MLALRIFARCSFQFQSSHKLNKVLANWLFFDREKAPHKSGAFTGCEE
jgi:hypothetical protein